MMEEKDKEIFGILYWAAFILIVTLFDPEMGCSILGILLLFFIVLRIMDL